MTDLAPGDLVASRFEIERRAARGGTSLIYRARDRASGALVALKVSYGERRSLERVLREGATLRGVSHPRLAAYVAHGAIEERAFVAWSWLEGIALDELLSRRRLAPRECVALGLALIEALRALHDAGLAHGDVTPANVILPSGALAEATLIDLGAATRLDDGTPAEDAAGTVGFVAPERTLGAPASPSSDAFGLGCVLFLALTGSAPFGTDREATPSRTMVQDAPRAWAFDDSLPVELDVLLARLLSRGAAERPALAEVERSLAAVLAALAAAPAPPPVGAERARPSTRVVTPLAPARPGERTLLGATSPFVGRSDELARLRDELARVRSCGTSCVVVVGPPGIGKSRLRDELAWVLAEDCPDVTLWQGRGDPHAAGDPLALLASSLHGAARLLRSDRGEAVHAKVRAQVRQHAPAADVDRIARFLSEALGAPEPAEGRLDLLAAREDPALMRELVTRAWIDLVQHVTASGPLIWILDDLHWGDAASLRVIGHAATQLASQPLFVLGFARPTSRALLPGASVLPLGPLGADACAVLAGHALGAGADRERATSIAARSLGNPLHLEELLRAEAGGSDAAGSVIALAHNRMQRTSAEKRKCLRAASVLDRPFPAAALEALLGEDGGGHATTDLLDALVADELLLRATDASSGGHPEYAFRHELVREAAYAALDPRERAEVHRLAAEWLSARDRADARTIAEHFAAGQRPEKAARWYGIAASRALAASDYAAADACGEQAVACGADGALLGAVRGVAAEAAWWRRDPKRSRRCAIEAKAFLPVGGALWHTIVGTLALMHGTQSDVASIDRLALDLLGARADAGARASRAKALGRAMGQLLIAGASDRAAELHRVMEEEAPLGGDHPTVLAELHRARALRALFARDPAAYLREMEARVAILDAVGDEASVTSSLNHIAYAYLALGAFERAEPVLRQVIARCQIQDVLDYGRLSLAWALAHLGAVEEAVCLIAAVADNFRRAGQALGEGCARMYSSRILAIQGDADRAEAEALTAAALLEKARPRRAQALAALADARRLRGEARGALEAASEAMRIVEAVGPMDEWDSYCRLVHVEALEASGAHASARAALRAARDELLTSAAKIGDGTLRRSFLERVTENARTLALSESWSV